MADSNQTDERFLLCLIASELSDLQLCTASFSSIGRTDEVKWGVSGPDVYLSRRLPGLFAFVCMLAGMVGFYAVAVDAGDKTVLKLGCFRSWEWSGRCAEVPGAHVPQANRADKIRVSGAQLEAFLS